MCDFVIEGVDVWLKEPFDDELKLSETQTEFFVDAVGKIHRKSSNLRVLRVSFFILSPNLALQILSTLTGQVRENIMRLDEGIVQEYI